MMEGKLMMFDHPDGDPVLHLTDDQCWKLLDRVHHGRLVTVVDGEPSIFPLNVVTDNRTLVIRTGPGSKFDAITANSNVLFEADGIVSDQAWSVIVRGTAKHLQTDTEVAEAQALGLKPWIPTPKEHYVRITPTTISGRHFQFGRQPEHARRDEAAAQAGPHSVHTLRRDIEN